MDYFARLKIQRACMLLDRSTLRVKEVGAKVGFSDPYYFSRSFRQVMGISPRAYRAVPKG
jgi:AraC-like DNA-binding protein